MSEHRTAGFSLIELVVVIGLTTILSVVALTQLRQSITLLDSDKAANVVVSQTRYAREVAIAQRRNVDLIFTAPNRIQVRRQNSGGGTTMMADVTLPANYTFGLPSGMATDTPDGYGNSAAIYFAGATQGTFWADGSFVNAGGLVTNGTVFTISSSTGNRTSRAVTLTGASGRTKQYYIQGSTWVQR